MDLDAWLDQAAAEHGYGSPYQRGDTDGVPSIFPAPRDVDISNFNNLAINFDPVGIQGASNTWSRANFDGDVDVDITDFNSLSVNFAPSEYSGTNSVPEPSSLFWIMLGAVVGLLCRHKGGVRKPATKHKTPNRVELTSCWAI